MFKVSFVYNGYQAEVTNETPDGLELDIIECRNVLHRLPAAIRPVPVPEPAASDRPASVAGQSASVAVAPGNEIIPVTSIEKTTLRNGKTAFKVRGGQYDVFGVMLYPDTCIFKDNIAPTMIMNEVVSGLEALVIKQGGKLRVAALRRKGADV